MDQGAAASGLRGAGPDDLYGHAVRAVRGATVEAPCLVCGGLLSRPRFQVEGVAAPVVVCLGCGLGRFHPMPGAREIADLYPEAYYGAPGAKFLPVVEAAVRWEGARHLAFLSRGLPPGARVLDVGCGRGVVLGSLSDRGFEVHGVESAAAAARGADPRAEIRIAPRLADAGYPEAHFDQAIVWHVLEHLPEPRDTLEELRRILRPGGRLIVAVPHFASAQARWAGSAWFHLDLPRHLHHFPLAALHRLLSDTGFEPISEHHFSLRQNPFGWIQSAQNKLPGLPRNGLYALLQRGGGGTGFGLGTRIALWAGFALGAAPALALSVWHAWRRRGATVHVVALRRPGRADGRRA